MKTLYAPPHSTTSQQRHHTEKTRETSFEHTIGSTSLITRRPKKRKHDRFYLLDTSSATWPHTCCCSKPNPANI